MLAIVVIDPDHRTTFRLLLIPTASSLRNGRMAQGHIDVADLPGTWRRSLLQDELGWQDRTTDVTWVQGPRALAICGKPRCWTPFGRRFSAT